MLGQQFDSLLGEARSGSRAALGAIYRDLAPGVLGYLRARAPADAEDLTSEVFLDVARGLDRFSGDEQGFRGWVFTIARRRAVDAGRRRARERLIFLPPEAFADLADGCDPATEAIGRLRDDETVALVRRLTPLQADVVLLRVLGGLSVQETALAVGRRPGAVRVLQHRALRTLAELVEPRRVGARGNGQAKVRGNGQHDPGANGQRDRPVRTRSRRRGEQGALPA